jgi:Uma2 family endonuclease
MAIVSPILQSETIFYPESDGKPMAETGIHVQRMIYLITALNGRYRDDPMVYVIGNIFVYYEEGNPYKSVSPDTFVVFGVSKRERRVYKIWEEGKAPDVVFEITSKSTEEEDLGRKRTLYARLGVQEYFLFDPLQEYLRPPLQGYRLVDGVYRPVVPEPSSDGEVAVRSQILGVVIRHEESWPILYDAQTGERLLTPEELQVAYQQTETARQELQVAYQQTETARQELQVAYQQAETRAQQEAAARQEAEEEIKRLKAEVERLRQGRVE